MRVEHIETYDKVIVDKIAEIHLKTFEDFFLTFMGRGFLRQMYRSYCDHNKSGIIVAIENERVVGFLAYSEDLSALYKHMLKSRLIPFAWYSMGAFFRKPATFMRIVRAFLKPSESRRSEAYVELASIGVDPEAKGKGVGSLLINALKKRTDFDKFEYITLETDAVDNDAANRFYVKNGFEATRQFQTHEGRSMIEYRFCGKESVCKNENDETALHTQHH